MRTLRPEKMERQFGVVAEREHNGRRILIVDTKQAQWKGREYKHLNLHQRKKFDNLLFLKRAKDAPKIIYE